MSEPWPQTNGYTTNTLSNPYHRLMNTSGNAFRDHAGSMVSCCGCSFNTRAIGGKRCEENVVRRLLIGNRISATRRCSLPVTRSGREVTLSASSTRAPRTRSWRSG